MAPHLRQCLDGQQEIAKRRIADALRDDDIQAADTDTPDGDDGPDRERELVPFVIGFRPAAG